MLRPSAALQVATGERSGGGEANRLEGDGNNINRHAWRDPWIERLGETMVRLKGSLPRLTCSPLTRRTPSPELTSGVPKAAVD